MLILAIIVFGMVVGAGAQLILRRRHGRIDWTMAIVAGLVGSFVGGLLISLLSGDGLDLRPSGVIGSLVGALVVTAGWRWWEDRNKPTAADRAAKRSGDPRKANPR
ncbi:MAG TPA: GlsB/YeaQ/YmgE family stress response membrane protein [Nocardioides sp.]|uniref:GlsB/YeaQ/YmgE family stress response membrane protein n=1 Tax=Nocardioides sp. TaxID=35761 RepID=UPI002CA1F32D|nr:GlsB/YeaQ/YmgE family stress response membrane protein [Nocardioides sp.]HQR25413.1 GlsB/YeaQ/YmgE family stress response membrane protein [Nocardioides sp.]